MMNFENINKLLKTNTTVKLISVDNAPLIISFLFQSFKQNKGNINTDTILEKDLIILLADYLYIINKDEILFPQQPKQYLTDWTNAGFLRKFPAKNDEFLFELTPETEDTFKWIDSLEKREFVGTESRMKNLFGNLKELSSKTKSDYEFRIDDLEENKKNIEHEIENVKQGKIELLDERQIKEQYYLIEESAKHLLADFKQVEQNFRDLDRNFRKKIITTSQTKGKVLEELFKQHDFLLETDQGKSFTAFWEFLLSQSKQDEFEKLINEVNSLPVVKQIQRENFRLDNIRNSLIEAGDKTNKTTNSLLEQLRKYLEFKSFYENKRIHDNITEMLKIIGDHDAVGLSKVSLLEVDSTVNVDLILNRPLFEPPDKIQFSNPNPEEGTTSTSNDILFEQFEIDLVEMKDNIKSALKNKSQISFPDFIKEFEIKKGVAEVIAYIEIASKEKHKHIVNESSHDYIEIKNAKTEKIFKVKIPQIIFNR